MNQKIDYVEPALIEKVGDIGPGARLKAAREAARLSKVEVAARLHLRESLIDAIEQDNYADSPAFVFVRGYLRAYANLVSLSADEIIKAFNQLKLEESEHLEPIKLLRDASGSSTRLIRWVSVIFLLALVIGVGIWWHKHKEQTMMIGSEVGELLSASVASVLGEDDINNNAIPNSNYAATFENEVAVDNLPEVSLDGGTSRSTIEK